MNNRRRQLNFWQNFLGLLIVLNPFHTSTKTQKSAAPEHKIGARANRTRQNPILAITGVIGLLLICCGVIALLGVIYANFNSDVRTVFAQNAEPALEQISATRIPPPDVQVPPTQPAGSTEEALDSVCPLGAPTITFKGPLKIGSKEWFDSLPKEPQQGVAICVSTTDYSDFLVASGTWSGKGELNGKKMTGLEVLAHWYSSQSTGTFARVEELKKALSALTPGKMGGVPKKDTSWITLPGYTKAVPTGVPPLCPSGNCFDATPGPTRTPTATPFQPLKEPATAQPTSMFTPTPPYVDLVLVPTIPVSTPVPQVATALRNLSPDEWLALYEGAVVYQGSHCQHIYNGIDLRAMSSSELWAYTTKLEWRNGELGWFFIGDRRDVFVPNYGEYVIYAVCGYVTGMPDTNNIDGNGTRWQGGISVFYPPQQPDPLTGLVHVGDTYYVNVFGQWFAPAYPAPSPLATPVPTLTIMQALNINGNGLFADWFSRNNEFPTAGNPKILMYHMGIGNVDYYIDFTPYLSHINTASTAAFMLIDCTSQYAVENGGFQIATQVRQTTIGPVNDAWCIVPGK